MSKHHKESWSSQGKLFDMGSVSIIVSEREEATPPIAISIPSFILKDSDERQERNTWIPPIKANCLTNLGDL